MSDQIANDTNQPPNDGAVRIGLIQHACGPDPAVNLATATKMIRDAAGRGAQIIATQELFHHQYFPQVEEADRFRLAETIPGPTSEKLCALASELGVLITVSLFEKRAPGLYHNTSIMISPDGGGTIIGVYRKMHIPDDPGFYEKFFFTPGDAPASPNRTTSHEYAPGWQVQQTAVARTGLLICWDQWFPEAARLTALQGAQILFYPTAIGWSRSLRPETSQERKRQVDAWQTMQRSHAIANGVFVVAINRVGIEDDLEFWGHSFVADPGGSVIAQAGSTDEAVLVADCDLSLIDEYRQAWPFLRDRRVDAYGDLTKRYVDHP